MKANLSRVRPHARDSIIHVFRDALGLKMLVMIGLLLFLPLTAAVAAQNQQITPSAAAPAAMPHVVGNRIVDGSGHTLVLQGAHISSDLYVISPNASEQQASEHLDAATFNEMHNVWKMNTLRLFTSDFIWQENPSAYIAKLQNIVQMANTSGLYVVITLVEDGRGGSPYDDSVIKMPSSLAVTFWKAIAQTFKANPMVMYDLFNEPRAQDIVGNPTNADWQFWLHGGTRANRTVVGMQKLTYAIRGQGAQQIIIGEALNNTFQTIGNNLLAGKNIVYSVHQYFQDNVRTPASWDLKFGNLGKQVPIFIGEWAFTPNTNYPTRCDKLTSTQAIALVNEFIAYMKQHGTSWTAYAFMEDQLILNYTNYTPTTLSGAWVCAHATPIAQDGDLVQQYLTQ